MEYLPKLQKADKSMSDEVLQDLVLSIKSDFPESKDSALVWDKSFTVKIPKLIAKLGALWTLKNTDYLLGEEVTGIFKELLQPHPGQLMSLFRMMGVGYKNNLKTGVDNNLIEIGTGEGKSLVLAIASIIFALAGADVYCTCYSSYLSRRDEGNFSNLYSLFDVKDQIKYGTFNQLCEAIINEQGSVRDKIMNLIFNIKGKATLAPNPNKVLLIDEVDVFFSKEVFGGNYFISAPIRDPSVSDLMKFVWDNRAKSLNLAKLKKETVYSKICERFPGWETIIDEAIKHMLNDLKDFNYDYVIRDGRIGVQEHSQVVFNKIFGYKTAFVHFKECEANHISQDALESALFLNFKCGNFSYAEIGLQFNKIIGVTGTLKDLSKSQIDIIDKYFNIKQKTFVPSVFGESKRKFPKSAGVFLENSQEFHHLTLIEQIKQKLAENRAVLVFFESIEELMAFKNFEKASALTEISNILTEKTDEAQRDLMIKVATNSGMLTLLTKELGRGVDFICRDKIVLNNGGVHVIQTFFSEEKAEEVQIMGRCGRQGQPGSFSIVLLNKNLEKFLSSSCYVQELEDYKARDKVYDKLSELRDKKFDSIFLAVGDGVKSMKEVHDQSMKLKESAFKEEPGKVKDFLTFFNACKQEEVQSKTLILLDGTESMDLLMEKVKNNLHLIFERVRKVLTKEKKSPDCFQIQICIYRDYDCGVDEILQVSTWESNPGDLKIFMDSVETFGGDDFEESIETALWHANLENKREKLTQILLIGDAPAKSREAILASRKQYEGEDVWKKSRYGEPTYFEDEIKKLNGVPIYSFYLDKAAEKNFKEIASTSKGSSREFDLEKMKLEDLIAQNVLQSLDKALATKYMEMYGGASYT